MVLLAVLMKAKSEAEIKEMTTANLKKAYIDLAREYNVDQHDILESFLCELLGVKPDELYMILDDDNE